MVLDIDGKKDEGKEEEEEDKKVMVMKGEKGPGRAQTIYGSGYVRGWKDTSVPVQLFRNVRSPRDASTKQLIYFIKTAERCRCSEQFSLLLIREAEGAASARYLPICIRLCHRCNGSSQD